MTNYALCTFILTLFFKAIFFWIGKGKTAGSETAHWFLYSIKEVKLAKRHATSMKITLPLVVTFLTICLMIAAFATKGWHCGYLFSSECEAFAKKESNAEITFKAGKWLLVISGILLIVSLLIEIVVCSVEMMDRKGCLNFLRYFLHFVVLCFFLTSTLLLTHVFWDMYSYFCVLLCFGFVLHANQIIFSNIGCFGDDPDPILTAAY